MLLSLLASTDGLTSIKLECVADFGKALSKLVEVRTTEEDYFLFKLRVRTTEEDYFLFSLAASHSQNVSLQQNDDLARTI